jgi:hypothetical protein
LVGQPVDRPVRDEKRGEEHRLLAVDNTTQRRHGVNMLEPFDCREAIGVQQIVVIDQCWAL